MSSRPTHTPPDDKYGKSSRFDRFLDIALPVSAGILAIIILIFVLAYR